VKNKLKGSRKARRENVVIYVRVINRMTDPETGTVQVMEDLKASNRLMVCEPALQLYADAEKNGLDGYASIAEALDWAKTHALAIIGSGQPVGIMTINKKDHPEFPTWRMVIYRSKPNETDPEKIGYGADTLEGFVRTLDAQIKDGGGEALGLLRGLVEDAITGAIGD